MPSIREFIANAIEQGYTKEDLTPELLKKGYTKEEIKVLFSPSLRTSESTAKPLIEKIKLLFSHPQKFFQEVNEKSIKPTLIAYSLTALCAAILGIVLLSIIGGFFLRGFFPFFGISLIFPLILFVFSVAGTFIYAGLSHGMIKLVKGKGTFTQTYNACTYSLLPATILAIIPYIGWLSIIYSIVLMTFGLSEYHQISKGKAVIAALTPLILAFLILGLLIFYIFFFIFRGF